MTVEEIQDKFLGGEVVQPGHPMVVAFVVTMLYPNYATAMQLQAPNKPPKAITDGLLPGSEGAQYAALAALAGSKEAQQSFDEMVAFGNEWWKKADDTQVTSNTPKWKAGQEQADMVLPTLRVVLRKWLYSA